MIARRGSGRSGEKGRKNNKGWRRGDERVLLLLVAASLCNFVCGPSWWIFNYLLIPEEEKKRSK